MVLGLWACGDDDGTPGADAGTGVDARTDASAGDAGTGVDARTDASVACEPVVSPAADWFVSPAGTAGAAGTADDPRDLASLLAAAGPVQPGERVALQAGTYLGRFVATVSGSEGAPIVFAAEPGGRVILDSNAAGGDSGLSLESDWVEVHGIEVTSSAATREDRVEGVTILGAHTRLVNAIVHDNAQGIGFWASAVDSELYGNVIYNNGWEGPDRGHGHAIYTQNDLGTKRIAGNVIFFGFAFGIHAYTEGGAIRGFEIVDNVWFRTGASRPGASVGGTSDGCLVGGLQPVARTRLIGNHGWAPEVTARDLQLGYGGSVQNEDITLQGNYLVGRVSANGAWTTGTLEGNTVHGELSGIDPADWPDNAWSTDLPTGTRVVVQRNLEDAGRADLVIFNWDDAASVPVDLSAVLPPGAAYAVYSVYDLLGAPVVEGGFDGAPVAVPLGARPPPQPDHAPDAITGADDPGRTFGVFVLRSSCRLLPGE
jgi:hypothetical protein